MDSQKKKNVKSISQTINQETGRSGENMAVNYMVSLGFRVLHQNYRYRRGEIDLIVEKNGLLVFVEVKYRKGIQYGYPEEFVSPNQQQSIIQTADQYIHENNWQGNIRFDIIAINGDMEVKHFEDAFY